MERHSMAFLELQNLVRLLEISYNEMHNTSVLKLLRSTAKRLIPHVWVQEKKAAIEIIEKIK